MYGLRTAKHRSADARTRHSEPCAILSSVNRCVQTADGEAPGHAAAGPPGADMHVIFDAYTEQDENFYRAILGEDEKPANDAEE